MNQQELFYKIECLLFVSGDVVSISDLATVFECSLKEMKEHLHRMEEQYKEEKRGIQLLTTEETVQLTSNKDYIDIVEKLLQPEKKKSASQSILESLAVVAYRQPVTKADIENVRGVLCDYALSQLQKMGYVMTVGHKDTPGKPNLYGTTDKFLHQFGLHSLEELPEFTKFSELVDLKQEDNLEEIPVV